MAERFEERFKGKTSKMDKNGLATLMDRNATPATKDSGQGFGVAARGHNSIPAKKGQDSEAQAGTRHQPGSEAVLAERQRPAKAAAGTGPGDRKSASMQKPKQGGPMAPDAMEAGARVGRQDASQQASGWSPEQLSNSSSSNRLHEQAWQQPLASSPGKIGAQFQQNAFMMMTPYQFQPAGPVYPQMLMQPVMQVGYPHMAPGYPMQPLPPTAHTYSAGYAPAYWGVQPPFDDGQKRYGLTEQGSFKVASAHQKPPRDSDPPRDGLDATGKKAFTPYTLEEYKTLSKTHNNKLGGLGANHDGHWEEKVKKTEKAKDYAKMIRGMNSDKIRNTSKARPEKTSSPPKQPTLKDKALEFARKVPRPKPKKAEKPAARPPEAQQLDEEIGKMEDDLDALERQHQFYQEKIKQLKA